jgi:uncharacterized membrane protein YqiK
MGKRIEMEKKIREQEIAKAKAVEAADIEKTKVVGSAEINKRRALELAEQDRAVAIAEKSREQSEAEAERRVISVKVAAEAEQRYRVEAEGKRAINEAENLLAAEQINREIKLALIDQMPEIIRESAKPMEQIDGIKIFQVDGLNGHSGNGNNNGEAASNGSLADQGVNSALRYRVRAPLVEGLLNELGLKGGSLNGLTAGAFAEESGEATEG